MSPADSGEYVCRVVGGSVPLESSVLVSIEPADSVPGEWCGVRRGGSPLQQRQDPRDQQPPSSTHTLPSPPPPSWGFTLWPLSPALGVTPPVRIESSSSHVAEGQTLDLNCLVSGQPHAQVTWHKRGGNLPAGHQVGGRELRGEGGLKDPRDCGVRSFEFRCCSASLPGQSFDFPEPHLSSSVKCAHTA